MGFRWDGHYGPEMGGIDPTCHWVVHISQKYVSTPQMFGTNIRIERKSQIYGSTPQMFDMNIRIELKMLHFIQNIRIE